MYEEYISRCKRRPDGSQVLYLDVKDFEKTGFLAKVSKILTGIAPLDIKKLNRVQKYLGQNNLTHFDLQEYYLCVGDRAGTKWEPNCE